MNFLIQPYQEKSSDIPESRQLINLSNTLNSRAQKYKRQEILSSKRKNFDPSFIDTAIIHENPEPLISELYEIMNRNFNKSSISNTHKNKNIKNLLGDLRKSLYQPNELIKSIKNFDVYLDLLIRILKNNPTDILFESLRNISLLTFHSHLFDSRILIVPLMELVEVQEKKLNIANANIILEKALFSIGNLALESNYHHELFIKSKLPELIVKILYRNDINLLTTGLWALSNLFRQEKEFSLNPLINSSNLYKVLMHLFNKFNENNNPLLISELLWMLAIITNISNSYDFFDSALILKITWFLPSQNIKLSIPSITILANLAQFLGDNCFELIRNPAFQSVIEKILLSNIFIWKRELVFLLANFVAVDYRIAEFFLANNNLMSFVSEMFGELANNNNKDDIFHDLCYFFLNIASHKTQNFGKVLTENYRKVFHVFQGLDNSLESNVNVKNIAKAFLSLIN